MAAAAGPRLVGFTESERAQKLATLESYYRCKQYDSRPYSWDGSRDGYGAASPGLQANNFYIPEGQRRPCTRIDMPRRIVKRLTSFVLGHGAYPTIIVKGDKKAEDYVRALAVAARLQARLIEARNLGGAEGAVGLGFAIVNGKPRIRVHDARHTFVLRWEDRDELIPGAVLETYSYKRYVFEKGGERPQERKFWHARLFTETSEIVWEPIPESLARQPAWSAMVKHRRVDHNFGFCPIVWVQNTPNSTDIDGEPDFEGTLDKIDDMAALSSQVSKGTRANVDPTLVVKDTPGNNSGVIHRGTGHALYSEKGAEYLELKGDSVKTAIEWLVFQQKEVEATTQTVFPDPEKVAAKAQSAAALRMVYMPMLSHCDILRDQYGHAAVDLLKMMLRVCKGETPARVVVNLPPRVIEEREGEGPRVEQLEVGQSDQAELVWPPYFPDTLQDIKTGVEAASVGTGGRPVVSQQTAVRFVAPLVGNPDTEEELARIAAEEEKRASLEEERLDREAQRTGAMNQRTAEERARVQVASSSEKRATPGVSPEKTPKIERS